MRISDWSSDVCSSDLQAVDHAVGEAGELDAERAHDLGAAELEAVGEIQHGAAVEYGGPGVGGADRRCVRRDRLRDPGRRDATADPPLALVGLKPVAAAAFGGKALPDRQRSEEHTSELQAPTRHS